MTRRQLLARSVGLALLAGPGHHVALATSPAARKFTIDLVPGMIGVETGFPAILELAAKHGFESIGPDPGYLAKLSDDQTTELIETMKRLGLKHGAAGLPVEFRRDEATFLNGLKELPAAAKALQRAGATRVGTYIMPNHAELTYSANMKLHADRLRQVASILGDHGQRFGLEYVGPKTLWAAKRYPFIHSMAELKDLIALIDRPNVGVVLDSWHWYTAGDSKGDLLSLSNDQVIACDLNDAPTSIPVDQQLDQKRELPASTGVIDIKTFLEVLIAIGYDGPVRAEPFNQALRELNDDQALAATAKALKAAVALAEGNAN
jgi:sugar phosphate isomerase/epimerase